MMNRESSSLDQMARQLLQQTASYFQSRQASAYLVGGSVRNLLLNEPCSDWDIATDGDAPKLARRLADKLGGYYAHLHEKASRIIIKSDNRETTLDIAPLQGGTIEADLRLRDFTLNAIAIPLTNFVPSAIPDESPSWSLIDPLQGSLDLQARTLRAVDDTVFQRDPLRLLRAVRFSMRYQLTIEPHTARLIKRDASHLLEVAPERIHEELYAILKPDGATERLYFLEQHNLFMTLFPEFLPARGMPQPELHHWDVLDHSLETVGALERLAALLIQTPANILASPLGQISGGDLLELQALLNEAQDQNLFHFTTLTTPAMKLAALLHDIGKTITYAVDEEGDIHFYGHPQLGVPLAQHIMKRLSASTQDRRTVQQAVAHHMRPGQLSHDIVTPRAIRRYFIDLGPAGITVALIALADHLAMRGPEPLTAAWTRHLATVCALLTRYIRQRGSILPPRLIQPEELIRRLHLERGPIVGQLLEYIAEAQADGLIHSKDDALWLAEEKLSETL